ncbi:MAG: sulfatase-like hydrolase/transferase, partial [Muribaculaceae bacterium]|nr:sulfatase-like hydrolase/transferase [Muribaculaceae bacterium]
RGDALVQFAARVETVLNTLDSLGLADNTIVILSSDNGPVVDDGYLDEAEELLDGHSPTGELRGGKYSAFEGGTRVPLIVRWPGKVESGQTSEALISQIDWLASLASLTGARIPQGAANDSHDNFASLIGEDRDGRDYVIEQAANHALSVRTKEWKYIEPSKGTPMVSWGPKIETGYLMNPQLYDMVSDPLETTNVADQYPELVKKFSDILESERTQSDTK